MSESVRANVEKVINTVRELQNRMSAQFTNLNSELIAIKLQLDAINDEEEKLFAIISDQSAVAEPDWSIAILKKKKDSLTLLERSLACADLRDQGSTALEIASGTGFTPRYVFMMWAIADSPLEIHEMIKQETVSATLVFELLQQYGPFQTLAKLKKARTDTENINRTRITRKDIR